MQHSPDSVRAALLLTNRLVPLDAQPLTAREFWDFTARHDPGDLVNRDAAEHRGAHRLVRGRDALACVTLLDASTALELRTGPPRGRRNRARSRRSTIAFLRRSATDSARRARRSCSSPGRSSGSIDLVLASSALATRPTKRCSRPQVRPSTPSPKGGPSSAASPVVSIRWRCPARSTPAASSSGVPAEGILKASRNAEIRRRVHGGELCIASPYAPGAPFTAGNAMGRNKIIYALSRVTFWSSPPTRTRAARGPAPRKRSIATTHLSPSGSATAPRMGTRR